MNINILYIDDQQSDLDRYGDFIEECPIPDYQFKVQTKVGTNISENPKILEEQNPDLIFVDFDFSNVDSANHVLGMNGATLSNLLRQKFPEVPIVLLTRETIEKSRDFPQSKEILACIDEIALKEHLIPPDPKLINCLISLSVGYKSLRACENKNWNNLINLILAPSKSIEFLKKSYPIEYAKKNNWNAFEAAFWIRKILLKYPGIVYNDIFAATYLGISIDSFNKEEVKSFFSPALYQGIFVGEQELWWKTTLNDIVYEKMNDIERNLPLRKGFVKCWERTFGIILNPSVCNYKNDSPADTVCCLLNTPVMLKYSLRYFLDPRPDVMDEPRISFKAIQTRNDVNFDLFDEIGIDIIKERKLKP